MFDIGGGELLLILLVVLLLFGPHKLPEVAQLIGKGVQRVRRAQEELVEQIREINTATVESTKPLVSATSEIQQIITELPHAIHKQPPETTSSSSSQ